MKPLQIAVSGGHTIAPSGSNAQTWTWTKAELGVPEEGIIKDVIFNQEGANNVFLDIWISFDVKADSVTIRCYNNEPSPKNIKFRLSVLYTI